MIAVFGNKQEPCSPIKRRKEESRRAAVSVEDEQILNAVFDTLAESLPRRHRAEIEEHIIGSCNGVAYIESARQSYASTDNACAFFKGEYPGLKDTSAAEALLAEYQRDPWEADAASEELNAQRKLSTLQTPYAFIIFDNERGLVFAARDPKGLEQMFWGSNSDGDLLFSTDRNLLENSCADADLFPAGALFVSDVDSTSGRIVDILPIAEEDEDDEESQLCRSVSRSDLGGMGSRVASQSQIAAQ